MDRRSIEIVIEESRKECEKDRLILLAEANENWDGKVEERFGLETVGCHEAVDRLHLVSDIVQNHLLDHPTVILDARAYEMVNTALNLLLQCYQVLARDKD